MSGAANGRQSRPERGSRSCEEELKEDFYGSALAHAERIEYKAAERIEGLDQEIAVLRTRLRKELKKERQSLPVMLRSIDLLVKAVAARYRISKEAKKELGEALNELLQDFGGQLDARAAADE